MVGWEGAYDGIVRFPAGYEQVYGEALGPVYHTPYTPPVLDDSLTDHYLNVFTSPS